MAGAYMQSWESDSLALDQKKSTEFACQTAARIIYSNFDCGFICLDNPRLGKPSTYWIEEYPFDKLEIYDVCCIAMLMKQSLFQHFKLYKL